ncbi:hypothetical protein ACHAWO_008152 [Cyclotella atomus]|jgi:20S proteasome subunit beta 6|uniref:Proteasome endopeptidase complex n=1 Tax=Cyclotella atomus TaxID=382360 RepID=A0ABD3PM52_9STRA
MLSSASLTVLIYSATAISSAQKFDPYQLNGGLVAAVAGKDYVLIASDTRMTDGGYGINSRKYLNGRIWSASSSSSSSLLQSSAERSATDESRTSFDLMPAKWEPDGSLALPTRTRWNHSSKATRILVGEQQKASGRSHLLDDTSPNTQTQLPVLIGSAGCASDCESLKRRVRLELDALECNFPTSSILGVQSVANLLQQVLYGRRGLPFYSFCVVAGIDNRDSHGEGAVYVYDAIGSFERVAVGCSGTGRELLQPILDRLFSESSRGIKDVQTILYGSSSSGHHDIMSIPAVEQRHGVAGSLRPPVRTTVNCTWQEAVDNVARGFQAVAEREISVGDELVVCLLRSRSDERNDPSVDVISFKLKKH